MPCVQVRPCKIHKKKQNTWICLVEKKGSFALNSVNTDKN